MNSLHITNGDMAARLIEQSTIPGEVLPWRDPMHHGPFPCGLGLVETSQRRARYLAEGKPDLQGTLDAFRWRDETLLTASTRPHVVLWFEHDVLDQLQVLQILDVLGALDLSEKALEWICIDQFPEVPRFRGLGQLNIAQIATLYDQRRPLASQMLDAARAGWAAFRSDDPRDLLDFTLAYDPDREEALRFLRPALLRHMQEFPDHKTGLTRTEAQLLGLVASGVDEPIALFEKNMDLETNFFIGDWHTWCTLDRLVAAGLLTIGPAAGPVSDMGRDLLAEQRVSLTETGHRVMAGHGDAFDLVRREGWLGGVAPQSDGLLWTWNDADTAFAKCRIQQ